MEAEGLDNLFQAMIILALRLRLGIENQASRGQVLLASARPMPVLTVGRRDTIFQSGDLVPKQFVLVLSAREIVLRLFQLFAQGEHLG